MSTSGYAAERSFNSRTAGSALINFLSHRSSVTLYPLPTTSSELYTRVSKSYKLSLSLLEANITIAGVIYRVASPKNAGRARPCCTNIRARVCDTRSLNPFLSRVFASVLTLVRLFLANTKRGESAEQASAEVWIPGGVEFRGRRSSEVCGFVRLHYVPPSLSLSLVPTTQE